MTTFWESAAHSAGYVFSFPILVLRAWFGHQFLFIAYVLLLSIIFSFSRDEFIKFINI